MAEFWPSLLKLSKQVIFHKALLMSE